MLSNIPLECIWDMTSEKYSHKGCYCLGSNTILSWKQMLLGQYWGNRVMKCRDVVLKNILKGFNSVITGLTMCFSRILCRSEFPMVVAVDVQGRESWYNCRLYHYTALLCTDSSIQNVSFCCYQAKNFKDLMHCNRFCYLPFAFVFCYESFLKCVVLRQLFSPLVTLFPHPFIGKHYRKIDPEGKIPLMILHLFPRQWRC